MNTKRRLREGQEIAKKHRYNLIPDAETFGRETAEEFREKMLALEAAHGRAEVYRELYEDVDAFDVYELDALQTAYHWND